MLEVSKLLRRYCLSGFNPSSGLQFPSAGSMAHHTNTIWLARAGAASHVGGPVMMSCMLALILIGSPLSVRTLADQKDGGKRAVTGPSGRSRRIR